MFNIELFSHGVICDVHADRSDQPGWHSPARACLVRFASRPTADIFDERRKLPTPLRKEANRPRAPIQFSIRVKQCIQITFATDAWQQRSALRHNTRQAPGLHLCGQTLVSL